MKEAIQKAIEGGYERGQYLLGMDELYDKVYEIELDSFLLEPLFWQSLGKAMGWEGTFAYTTKPQLARVDFEAWWYHWHRFIDHLAEGKDAESFFNDLLK